jgi:hypothetical protein
MTMQHDHQLLAPQNDAYTVTFARETESGSNPFHSDVVNRLAFPALGHRL